MKNLWLRYFAIFVEIVTDNNGKYAKFDVKVSFFISLHKYLLIIKNKI